MLKKTTNQWLKTQELTAVGYWGDGNVNLWEVLDIYAQAVIEGESAEDALYSNFPDIADDIQIDSTENPGYACGILHDFEDCPRVMIFIADQLMESR